MTLPFSFGAAFILAIFSSSGVWSICLNKPSVENGTNEVTFQTLKKYVIKSQISTSYNAKGLQPFFNLAKSFMNTVQPKDFGEFIKDKSPDEVRRMFGAEWKKFVKGYELPIIICMAIGVLFAVVMPITGFCFCCCRCCKKCGGDMKQSDKNASQHCKVWIFILLLCLFSILILCGVLFMFVTNNRINEASKEMVPLYRHVIDDGLAVAKAVVRQLRWLTEDQALCITGLVRDGLTSSSLKEEIGEPLKNVVKQNVSSVLDLGMRLSGNINGILIILNNVTATTGNLISIGETLEKELNTSQDNLNAIVEECKKQDPNSEVCKDLEKIELTVNIDLKSLPSVKKESDDVKTISDKNLDQYIDKARNLVEDIPNIVVNKSRDGVKKIIETIDDAEKKIKEAGQKVSDEVDKIVDDVKKQSDKIFDGIEQNNDYKKYESIRWKVYIGIASLMAFIVVLLFCGLACGSCGYKKDYMPTERTSTSNCGGDFLMAAVGFMFIFSIILMLFCVVSFAAGMHTHIFCREMRNGAFVDNVVLKNIKELEKYREDMKMSDILSKCRQDSSLYKATPYFKKNFDIESKLNVSQLKEAAKDVDDIDFNLKDKKLVSKELKDTIKDLLNSDIKDIDFAKFYKKLNESITSQSLEDINSNLTKLANRTANPQLSKKIDELIENLTRIGSTTVNELTSEMAETISIVKQLESSITNIMSDGNNLLDLFEYSQNFVEETESYIKQLVKKLADKFLNWIEQGVSHIILQIKNNFANCQPITHIYDGVINTFLCNNVVQNTNGYWLALGWCLLFFIPSIILAVKLAKYFRRMEYTTGMDTIVVDNPPYNEKAIPMHGNRPPPPYSISEHNNPGYQHL